MDLRGDEYLIVRQALDLAQTPAPKVTEEVPRNSRAVEQAHLTPPGGSLYETYQAFIPSESSSHAEPRNWP